jgi:YegS/Rv2252/BmrU family lipid kinase
MPATVIVNPYSNRWETGRRIPEIEAGLKKANIDYVLQITENPGHGVELAKAAVMAGNTPLIAVGGDGSVSEVVNGLMQSTPPDQYPAGPIGFLPLGTANDLTDVLGIPRELDDAIKVIAGGHTRVIDVGSVNGHIFDNNSAIGLEPMVTIENIRLTWLRGVIRYMISAIITILKRPTWEAHLIWDTGEYKGSITLVSVGNTRRTGGVFYMTPNASVDDGLLDFVYAPALGRLRLFQLLPKTQTGAHIDEPEITVHQTKQLTIQTHPPTPIQADGELIATEATEIIYKIIPKALRVYLPTEKNK